jgi:hypothetical protein
MYFISCHSYLLYHIKINYYILFRRINLNIIKGSNLNKSTDKDSLLKSHNHYLKSIQYIVTNNNKYLKIVIVNKKVSQIVTIVIKMKIYLSLSVVINKILTENKYHNKN